MGQLRVVGHPATGHAAVWLRSLAVLVRVPPKANATAPLAGSRHQASASLLYFGAPAKTPARRARVRHAAVTRTHASADEPSAPAGVLMCVRSLAIETAETACDTEAAVNLEIATRAVALVQR